MKDRIAKLAGARPVAFLAVTGGHTGTDRFLPDDGGRFSLWAGFMAAAFTKEAPAGSHGLREGQRRRFETAMPWVLEREGLPPCDSDASAI